MSFKHPDFPHILVQDGKAGEPPLVGKFYAATKGDTLSSISNKLIKTGQIQVKRVWDGLVDINNTAWNRANCKYREDSSDCSSKRVTKGGYVGLCQADQNGTAKALGLKYPVIWIASSDYAEPGDVPTGPMLWMGRNIKTNTSSIKMVTAQDLANKRAVAAQAAEAERNADYTYRGADNGANASTDSAGSSSYLPWIIGGIVIAAGAIFYATTRTDGRKKRR
jgi:hypothetical protein